MYAAPWRYALAAKLDRLSKPGFRSYDKDDAIGYLIKLIEEREGHTAIDRTELKRWATEYRCTVPSEQMLDHWLMNTRRRRAGMALPTELNGSSPEFITCVHVQCTRSRSMVLVSAFMAKMHNLISVKNH